MSDLLCIMETFSRPESDSAAESEIEVLLVALLDRLMREDLLILSTQEQLCSDLSTSRGIWSSPLLTFPVSMTKSY